jgi:hypothetical protein
MICFKCRKNSLIEETELVLNDVTNLYEQICGRCYNKGRIEEKEARERKGAITFKGVKY